MDISEFRRRLVELGVTAAELVTDEELRTVMGIMEKVAADFMRHCQSDPDLADIAAIDYVPTPPPAP